MSRGISRVCLLVVLLAFGPRAAQPLFAADCNTNGTADDMEIAGGAADCNSNGVPDDCDLAASNAYYAEFAGLGDSLMTFNGTAIVNGGTLRLTGITPNQLGSGVFTHETADVVDAVWATFYFRMGGGSGGEGLCFSMLNAAVHGPGALFSETGPAGDALTVQFDAHQDGGDPSGNFVAVRYNGAVVATYSPSFDLDDNAFHRVDVMVAGGTITVRLNTHIATPETAFDELPIPGYVPFAARFGFGGRTSALTNQHRIDHVLINASLGALLDCTTNGVPDECELPPEPDCNTNGQIDACEGVEKVDLVGNFDGKGGDTPYTLNRDALVQNGALLLTPAAFYRNGTLVFTHPTPNAVTGFDANFDFRMGGGTGADGLSFVMLDATAHGPNSVFDETGSAIGALVVKFDTFDNGPQDPNGNHLALIHNGTTLATYTPGFDLDNNAVHHVHVAFDGGAVTVVLTPSAGMPETAFDAVPVPGYLPLVARFGFGGRTGSLTNEHWIDSISISAQLDAKTTDCNHNDTPDECDLLTDEDCNTNDVLDECEGGDLDCNTNKVPDICEPEFTDCNSNGTLDDCEGGDLDCNSNQLPDLCEPGFMDCNTNLTLDACELTGMTVVESFDDGLPAGWGASGLWHVTSSCAAASQPCDPEPWAYYGIDEQCDFDTGSNNSGMLSMPPVTLPAGKPTLEYCSRYDGEAGDPVARTGYDWAWVSVNGAIVDSVSNTAPLGEWENRLVDLSAYAGTTVTIAFHFNTVDGIKNDTLGWQVDRITLQTVDDCNTNGVPDECDGDCNTNGLADACELSDYQLFGSQAGFYDTGYIYKVNPLTGEATLFVDINSAAPPESEVTGVAGIATAPDGHTLYAAARSPNSLYSVDTYTGAIAFIGYLDDTISDLAFLPNGTLIGSSPSTEVLYEIDPNSAAIKQICGTEAVRLSGLAVSPAGDLFGSTGYGGGKGLSGTLYGIDFGKGCDVFEIGETGFEAVSGITFAPDGRLLGCTANELQLIEIDPSTGEGQLRAILFGPNLNNMDGLAFAAVVNDCNTNGVPDECDADCDTNGVADDCQSAANPGFVQGVVDTLECVDAEIQEDFDGDGDLDFVLGDGCDEVARIYRNIDGKAFVEVDTAFGYCPTEFATADLDGDKDLDLVFGDYCGSNIIAMLNNGDGTFGEPAVSSVGPCPERISVADLEPDGDPDLVVTDGCSPPAVWVLLNDGAGNFPSVTEYPAVGPRIADHGLADVNADGAVDIITLCDGTVEVNVNNGDGTFAGPVGYSSAATCLGDAAFTDLDGDRDDDVIAVDFCGSGVWVLLSNGDGTLADAVNYPVAACIADVVYADLNGDQRIDVVITDFCVAQTLVLLNNGDGTFDGPAPHPSNCPDYLLVVDVESDGDLDLVVGDDCADTALVFLNAGGTFSGPAAYPFGQDVDGLLAGDFDGDGNPDLLSWDAGAGSLIVLFGEGGGVFGSAVPFIVNQTCDKLDIDDVTVADVDNDGRDDLVFQLACCVFDGNGFCTSSIMVLFGRSRVSGDCNANGTPDVCDVAAGAVDCNTNELPDECEVVPGYSETSPILSPFWFKAPQSYLFVSPPTAGTDAAIRIDANSDFGGGSSESLNVFLNEQLVGTLFLANSDDCIERVETVHLSAAQFNALVAGGDALVEMFPGESVDDFCDNQGEVQVTLTINTLSEDCNTNMMVDSCETGGLDCNTNSVPDECEAAQTDCNTNGTPDACDLATLDCNTNGLVDACEVGEIAYQADFSGVNDSPYQLNESAALIGEAVRLTPAQFSQFGSAVFTQPSPTPVSACTASFDFFIGGGDGADGMSFSLLDAATFTPSAVFGEEGPGATGALVLGIDTFDNGFPSDPNDNHLSLNYNNAVVATYTPSFNLDNSQWHHVDLTLENGKVTVVLTPQGGSPETAFADVPIPGYVPVVSYVGFGGRTGGAVNEHWLDNVSIEVTGRSDCNANGTLDECDIASGASDDVNANGVPDECELCLTCAGDVSGDNQVDGDDVPCFVGTLLGSTPVGCKAAPCADMDGDEDVDGDDAAAFILKLLTDGDVDCP